MPRSFWPPYAGPSRHCFYEARALSSKGYDVHLICLARKEEINHPVHSLPFASISYISPRIIPLLVSLFSAIFSALFRSLPFTTQSYSSPYYISSFTSLLKRFSAHTTIIHFFTLRSYPFILAAAALNYDSVVELIDSYALNLSTRLKSTSFVRQPFLFLFLWVESFLYLKLESSLPCLPHIKAYTVVSPHDLDYLRLNSTPQMGHHSKLLVTSIASEFPELSLTNLSNNIDSQICSPTILFFGSLYYYPNVQALTYFTTHILSLLKLSYPELRVLVVGSKPSTSVTKMCRRHSALCLHQDVATLKPYFESAVCSIAPILSGSGQQNKIVESIAHTLPVLTTSFAATPLKLTSDHVFICDKPDDWLASMQSLLMFKEDTLLKAQSAYEFCRHEYSWCSLSSKYISIYQSEH